MKALSRAKTFIQRHGISDQDLIQDIYVIALTYDNPQMFHTAAMKKCRKYLSENNEIPIGIKVSYTYKRVELSDHQQALIADTIRDCCFNLSALDKTNCERDIAIFLIKCNNKDITYTEISKMFNLSVERIRQIINKNLRRLRYYKLIDRFNWNDFMASEVEGFIN